MWDCLSDDGHWNWATGSTHSFSNNGLTFSLQRNANSVNSICDVELPSNFEAEVIYISGTQYSLECGFGGGSGTFNHSTNKTWYYYRESADSTQDRDTVYIDSIWQREDIFKVRRENGILKLYHNNELVHTITSPTPLFNGIRIFHHGYARNTTIKDIKVKQL